MSGWTQPPSPRADLPTPVVGWSVPTEPEGLGIRATIGTAWRSYRRFARTLVAIAAVPQSLRALSAIPGAIVVLTIFSGFIDVIATYRFEGASGDPQRSTLELQRRLQDAMQLPVELSLVTAVVAGLAIAIDLIGLELLIAGALAAQDGRGPSLGRAFRDVLARGNALVVPAVLLGVAWAAISIPLTLSQSQIAMSDGFARQPALAGLLSLVTFAITIAAIWYGVRWSLAIPAILVEGVSLRRGLSRSAELTSGVRVRIFAILLVVGIIVGIAVGFGAAIVALILGFASRSLIVGIVTYVVALLILGLILAPLAPAALVHIYRVRAATGAGPTSSGGPAADAVVEPGVDQTAGTET